MKTLSLKETLEIINIENNNHLKVGLKFSESQENADMFKSEGILHLASFGMTDSFQVYKIEPILEDYDGLIGYILYIKIEI